MSWNVEDGRVSIRLACGHTIEATENDGGMDEVSPVTAVMLLATAQRRVWLHDCEPEIVDAAFNKCNVLCEHGALCELDLSHDGDHISRSPVGTVNCAWPRRVEETQLTPEQARDHIYAVIGSARPVVRGRPIYPEIRYES